MTTISSKACTLFWGVLLLTTWGCTDHSAIQDRIQPLALDGVNKTKAMQIGETILGRMAFTLQSIDPNAGVIRAQPLSGAQWFEFWRQDAATPFDLVESSLHTIRRTPELRFLENETGTQVQCTVATERLSLPSRDIAGNAQAYQFLTQSTARIQTLTLSPDQQAAMAWVRLPDDPVLARRILAKVAAAAKRQYQSLK